MKRSITVNIPEPCTQSWEHMGQTANGKFCSNCSTEVIDFSHMTIAQLQAYFQTASTKVCGCIEPFQLQQLNQSLSAKSGTMGFRFPLIMASVLTLLTTGKVVARSVPTVNSYVQLNHDEQAVKVSDTKPNTANTYLVKGSVKVKDGAVAIEGALVTIPALKLRAVTDSKGQFQFSVKGATNQVIKLVVSHVGYESQDLQVVLGATQKPLVISLATEQFLIGEVIVNPIPTKVHKLTLDTPKTTELRTMLLGGMIAKHSTRPSFFMRVLNYVGGWFK